MSNPDIVKHSFKVLIYDETGRVLLDTVRQNCTLEDADKWAEDRTPEEGSCVVEHIRNT